MDVRNGTEMVEGKTEEKACTETTTKEDKQEKGHGIRTDGEQEVAVEIMNNGKKLLFLAIETTGFKKDCDIIQISAIFGSQVFNQYVLPTKEIYPWATKMNGLTVEDEELYYKGNRVLSTDPKAAMESFIVFLKDAGEQVVLVAHNGHIFDVPRLLRVMDLVGVQLPGNVDGFLDSLLIFKKLYPGRSFYPQVELVLELLGVTYEAQNAIAEVKALQSLMGVTLQAMEDQTLKAVWEECFKPRSAF